MRPYMTEDEAGKKFCPIADCGADGNRAMNGEPQDYNRCIGSTCMFWGWEERVQRQGKMPDYTFERVRSGLGRCEAPGGAA